MCVRVGCVCLTVLHVYDRKLPVSSAHCNLSISTALNAKCTLSTCVCVCVCVGVAGG